MNASIFRKKTGTHLHYIREVYKFLIESYLELIANGYDSKLKDEGKIRDDLVILSKKKNINAIFRIETELRNLEKNNRVDIVLITPCSFIDETVDIIIECKIVGEDKYIDTPSSFSKKSSTTNGIMSFLSGKYSEKMPLAGMIGFIKEGNITSKINKIEKRIKKYHSANTLENLTKYEIMSNFEYSYSSKHLKFYNSSEITIYHLFFNFV